MSFEDSESSCETLYSRLLDTFCRKNPTNDNFNTLTIVVYSRETTIIVLSAIKMYFYFEVKCNMKDYQNLQLTLLASFMGKTSKSLMDKPAGYLQILKNKNTDQLLASG